MATISSSSPRGSLSPEDAGRTYRGPFAIMTVLFFMWGFLTVLNDVLIPTFKESFQLNYAQAMLVQFAFFGAYGIGALAYFIISMISGDPINRIGYKNGVVIGLVIAAAGLATFYPAAQLESYILFLGGLFVVGLGLAMLQIAANPYVTILGPERTASSRLNLSQAFNSFGTTIGPLLGGWVIFTVFHTADAHGANSVKVPYLCLAGAFIVLAVLFKMAHLPSFTNTEEIPKGIGALKHPHTALGMLAIFMYVGGEVAVGSAIVNFLGDPKVAGLTHEQAARYLALFWGGLMIGRFMGAFALSDMRSVLKRALIVAVPIVAFLVIAFNGVVARDVFKVSGVNPEQDMRDALCYAVPLAIQLVAFFIGAASAQRMLVVFGTLIIAFLAVGMFTTGTTAMWAILGVGLFCSVMWSNIFSLAIEGLGPLKSQGSSLLIMAVVGGAVLPPLLGIIADASNIRFGFIVPMVAFAYIVFYGLIGYRVGRKDI